MFEFSSPAFFSSLVHKRAVYVQLEILSHPYCLISFQNPSAQYHFCHIVSPPRHFWKRHPVLELGAVLSVLSEPNNKLTVMQKLSHRPARVESFFSCFDQAHLFCADENGGIDTSAKPRVQRCWHGRGKLLMRIISLWQLWLRGFVRSEFNYWLNRKV